MDEIKALAHEIGTFMQASAQKALEHYRPIAEQIIKGEKTDLNEIELFLDYMLDFCYDNEVLELYKRICRCLYSKHPELVYTAVMNYRDVWDDTEN